MPRTVCPGRRASNNCVIYALPHRIFVRVYHFGLQMDSFRGELPSLRSQAATARSRVLIAKGRLDEPQAQSCHLSVITAFVDLQPLKARLADLFDWIMRAHPAFKIA